MNGELLDECPSVYKLELGLVEVGQEAASLLQRQGLLVYSEAARSSLRKGCSGCFKRSGAVKT